MKSVRFYLLYKKAFAISLCSSIHTSSVFWARAGGRSRVKVPSLTYEPGIRHRKATFDDLESPQETQEVESEDDFDDQLDFMNIDKAYDLHVSETKKHKSKVQKMIVAKKFFAPRPQPLMLTWNERECIKYLHKQDPVQWDLKTLSESFPATPDTIKKILKRKWKITPERAKFLDSKAQKNWELLAEGKLDADPHVLEHLKKFVNRREVLLEQIKSQNFYLPEIKPECVWNQGEMNNILKKYEKDLVSLVNQAQNKVKAKEISDGKSEENNEAKERKSSLDLIQKKIENIIKKESEVKDSFLYGKMFGASKNQVSLEELENQILNKAERGKTLNLTEEVILENYLGVTNQENSKNLKENESPTQKSIKEKIQLQVETESKFYGKNNLTVDHKNNRINSRKVKPIECYREPAVVPPGDKTFFTNEIGIGKLLNKIENKLESEDKSSSKIKTIQEKEEIDFSNPARLEREEMYFNNEVKHIENTAFWNNKKSSHEKAMMEYEKQPHEGPEGIDTITKFPKPFVLATSDYPLRIKIPKDKKGSGLTFKVKDCYYDDDGEFLYRVPGMIK